MNRSQTARARAKGNTQLSSALLLSLAVLVVGALGNWGTASRVALTGSSSSAAAHAPLSPVASSALAGLGGTSARVAKSAARAAGHVEAFTSFDAAGKGLRYDTVTVAAMRTFAAEIPDGETRVFRRGKLHVEMHRIPTLSEIRRAVDDATPLYAQSSANVVFAQQENLAYLIDRAFNETLARGNIPGEGGRTFSAKRMTENFLAAAVPRGVFGYNGHASAYSISTSKSPGALRYAREGSFERIVAIDLEQLGYRHEPLILDACSTAKCIDQPRAAARRVADALDGPVIAPTNNVFVTLPWPERGRNVRGRLVGSSEAVENGLRLPVASGDWVLVLPEAWGGAVTRGPRAADNASLPN